ncbi:Methylamine utilization protein MauG [Candidatus Nitrotoga sp. HW29]|uniref:cytochrome-c peroxidase n=1 Tax=Candidatus Nitrotoga sp. HW29 TaxID=2886963 RepID=UPI001EF196D8|nr:cytochrome c peroxidase [Candidatus Nitrotoga sp. HW29]CAH1905701.1 Methylamine utilization protein MauG [Candidatus Nitrotoga sp. HW29]
MMQKKSAVLILMLCLSFVVKAGETLTGEQQLGELLYKDENLSWNRNQSCASCHSLNPVLNQSRKRNLFPKLPSGFVDPENVKEGTPVSFGSIPGTTGSLNAPSAGYVAFSPLFHWDEKESLYVGGQFWNGRAGNLIEQAKGPFLNPNEMAMPDEKSVVSRLQENEQYRKLFKQIYRLNLAAEPYVYSTKYNALPLATVTEIYHHMAKAISAFEQSHIFNKFTSKFDYVLANMTTLTSIEKEGFDLFNGKAKCASCHVTETTSDKDGNLIPPMFTDFTYDNIGLPRNIKISKNPEPNAGLGGRADIAALDPNGDEIGKHKVMSLRNIALTPPYGHNGVFATLEQIVHFYNTRDTLGWVPDNEDSGFATSGWPDPEVLQNVNHDELGNLGLTIDEEKAIVAFMQTLTDDYQKWGKDRRVPPNTPSPFAEAKPPVL